MAAPVGVGVVWKKIRDLDLSVLCLLFLCPERAYSEVTQMSTSLIRVSSPSVVVVNLANTVSSCSCDTGAESVTPE